MIRPALACSIAIISASPLSAQAASLVGVWKVTYPAGARVENGQQSTIFGTGKLRIEARGDSLIGEFSPEPVPDLPEPKPIRIAGLTGTMPVALVSRQMTTVEVNDTRKLIGFTSTWKLEARGDSLSGTLSHRVEDPDVNAQDPGPVTGIRQRR